MESGVQKSKLSKKNYNIYFIWIYFHLIYLYVFHIISMCNTDKSINNDAIQILQASQRNSFKC